MSKEPRTFRPQVWVGSFAQLVAQPPPPPKKPKAGTRSQYEKGLRQGRGCCQGETPALSSGSLPLPHPLHERLLTQETFTQWGWVLPKPRLRKDPLGEGHGS